MSSSVASFLHNLLGLDHGFIRGSIGTYTVEKVIDPRSKVQQEAVVEFSNPAIRDAVKGMGYKLEGKRAGIRIEIPNFLKSDFYVLQNVAYKLKMVRVV